MRIHQPSTQKEFSAAVAIADRGDWIRLAPGCVWELGERGWSSAGYAATLRKSVALDSYSFVRNFESLFSETLPRLLEGEPNFSILGVRFQAWELSNGKVELRKSVPTCPSGVTGPCPPLGHFLNQAFSPGQSFGLAGTITAIL